MHSRQLERELAEARELVEMQKETMRQMREQYGLGERNVMRELRKQRDTLAEALHSIRHRLGDFQEPWNSRESYIDTIAHQAIAAVEGGSHE